MLTQDQIVAAYEKAVADDNHEAGQDIREADEGLEDALMNYVAAIQYETFCWAYELGYKAGQEARA